MLRVQVQQRHEPSIEGAGPRQVGLHHRAIKLDRFPGERVGEARHPAPGPERERLEHHIIQPRKQDVAIAERIEHIGEAPGIG